ncbi:hypothetical protein FACS189459_2090 [Bacilli bacterium]|nr:hypothetical protein FACS189459_2090 [Bacilli bacterium]
MQKKPFIKKLKHDFSDSPHFVFMEKGYHLLLKEEPTNEIIFSTINKSFTSK